TGRPCPGSVVPRAGQSIGVQTSRFFPSFISRSEAESENISSQKTATTCDGSSQTSPYCILAPVEMIIGESAVNGPPQESIEMPIEAESTQPLCKKGVSFLSQPESLPLYHQKPQEQLFVTNVFPVRRSHTPQKLVNSVWEA